MSRCNPLLCTPAQFYNLIGNRFRLKPNEFDPGLVSDVTHVGTGSAMRVTDLPYDAYVGEAVVQRSGDVVPSIGAHDPRIELTGTPTATFSVLLQMVTTGFFRYSTDAGANYTNTVPTSPTTINGVRIEFLGQFTAGETLSFSAIGPARVQVTVYNIANPIGQQGTGSIVPSGQVSRPYRIAVFFTGDTEFYYSVNGGKAVGPNTATLTIPGTGITLTLDPGVGPTYFNSGDYWIFSTRGSYAFDVAAGPILLSRPEQTGLRLVFDGPSLIQGETYSFSTTAPPDLLEMLVSASAEMMAMLRARYRNQILLNWDQSVSINTGRIMAETLYDRKGMNWKEDRQTYTKMAERALEWGRLVGIKQRHPDIAATPLPGVLAPRLVIGEDPEGINQGRFGCNDDMGFIRP